MKSLIKKFLIIFGYLIQFLLVVNCTSSTQVTYKASDDILINQRAYLFNQSKIALIRGYVGAFSILSTDLKDTIYKGRTSDSVYWPLSGESYATADFSDLTVPGNYVIALNNGTYSYEIHISSQEVYDSLAVKSLKTFYLHRTGEPILPEYAGKWAREAGHPDTNVIIHHSATNSIRNTGTVISSPKGWYDAGDYNKYIVNSAITVYTLLQAYNSYPEYFNHLDMNIPESDDQLPDIINEVLYNVRWMVTMQDLDGGLFHKLTTENFEGFVMPHDATQQRYVTMKTTSASLDFAASMAYCARTFSKFDTLSSFADTCLDAAKKAWDWAVENPDVFYKQPNDISTGEYNDSSFVDEWMWAGTELWLTTGDKSYFKEEWFSDPAYPFGTPMWDVVQTLGLMSFMTFPGCEEMEEYDKANTLFIGLMDKLYNIYKKSPAIITTDYFKWGSNSDVANQSMMAFMAYNIIGNKIYLDMAQANVDYLMGRNPAGYCYVTGFGVKSPMHIHHRPSGADSIPEPVPGFLVGGPNTIVLTDCGEGVERSAFPAKSYIDAECSYSTNEIAINWNAPLVYIAAAMAEGDSY